MSIVQILEMIFNRSRSRRILPGLVPQRVRYNTTELTDKVEPPTFHVFAMRRIAAASYCEPRMPCAHLTRRWFAPAVRKGRESSCAEARVPTNGYRELA